MTREDFLSLCQSCFGTVPDYPFENDFETAVLRHQSNNKWYGLVMRISRRKLGQDCDDMADVVNMKLPVEMFGSFGAGDGVYPAYHMNKTHWISVVLSDATDDLISFLIGVSYDITKVKTKKKRAL